MTSKSNELLLALLCFVIGIIPLTAFMLFLLLSEIYRQFLAIYLTMKHKQKIRLITGLDGLFVISEQHLAVTNSAIAIFQGEIDIENLKTSVRTSWTDDKENGAFRHPKLRNRIAKSSGYFYWLPEDNFSIDEHVQKYPCKPPENDQDLDQILSTVCNEYLPENISPWKLFVFPLSPNYARYAGQHYAILMRMHHSMSDGYSMVKMIAHCILDEKNIKYLEPRAPETSFVDGIKLFMRKVFYCPLALAQLVYWQDSNSLHGPKQSGKRLMRFSETIPLDRVKRVGKLSSATVNDVLTSCVTGALKRFYAREDSRVAGPVHAYVPISLHKPMKELRFLNDTSSFLVRLPLGDGDGVLERLRKVQKEILNEKLSNFYLIYNVVIKLLMNRTPGILNRITPRLAGATIVISNVAMYQNECFSKYGDRLKFISAFPSHIFYMAAGVAITSYNGGVQISMSVDKAVLDNAKTVDWFLATCIEEFEILEQNVSSTANGHH